jgi:hypothetical protein
MGGGGRSGLNFMEERKIYLFLGIETRLLGLKPVALLLCRVSYPGCLPASVGERKIFAPWHGRSTHRRSHWVSGTLPLRLKWPGREADDSPSSAEVKNTLAIPPLPSKSSWSDACLRKRHAEEPLEEA